MTSATDAGGPHTRAALAADLQRLGLMNGGVVLVHSSLRSLGYVAGGAVAVVQALQDVLGPRGTLVVPTFTAENRDPSRWTHDSDPTLPPDWWPTLREHLPAFDPRISPSQDVGAVAETVRTWPGAVRSTHPQTSFAALGPRAAELTEGHATDCHLGPDSPLGRLEAVSADILLLGVGYDVCTAFHLAEYQQPDPPTRDYECVIIADGRRTWYRYRDVLLDDSDFGALGAALEMSDMGSAVRRGPVGEATARLLPMTAAVSFARAWLAANRARRP